MGPSGCGTAEGWSPILRVLCHHPVGSAVVLLVESHEDSRDMYADCLRRCGFTVQTDDNADDGLKRARHADVIVTESRVHGSFDGIELVGRLRDAAETKQTPIIVLTSCAFAPDQQRARTAGCNVFLPKPYLPEQLVSEISAVIGRTIQDVPHRRCTVVNRLRAEYMEMPGLRLKAGQGA